MYVGVLSKSNPAPAMTIAVHEQLERRQEQRLTSAATGCQLSWCVPTSPSKPHSFYAQPTATLQQSPNWIVSSRASRGLAAASKTATQTAILCWQRLAVRSVVPDAPSYRNSGQSKP